MTLLSVHNLGKAFRSYRSEWQRFARWFGVPVSPGEEHWVLRHISFGIPAGEAVGIAGQNGAGKSTLLKLLTGTVRPTEGYVEMHGQVSAILELGMGFDPELTGRANVRHAAGLMGLTPEQIDWAMPGIEAFAEIGEYFDEAVRTYSSGMQMRVAFSVATAYRPDILIIDEALAVGDAYFQHKCFDRIREFQERGTTLLIASHDREAIQSLCSRAILLDKGDLIKDGPPEEIMDFYNALIAEKANSKLDQSQRVDGWIETRSGSNEAVIDQVRLLGEDRTPIELAKVGQLVNIVVDITTQAFVPELTVGYVIRDRLGQPIFGTNTYHLGKALQGVPAGKALQTCFTFPANLGVGSYSVSIAAHAAHSHVVASYDWWDCALIFQVVNAEHPQFTGVAWIPPQVECLQ